MGRGRAGGSPVGAGWLSGVEPQRPPAVGRRTTASAAGFIRLRDYKVKQKQVYIRDCCTLLFLGVHLSAACPFLLNFNMCFLRIYSQINKLRLLMSIFSQGRQTELSVASCSH